MITPWTDAEVSSLEQWALGEETMAVFRHDFMNRLAAVRNASFYLAKKTSKTDLWQSDARVQPFFKIIDDEVTAAEALLAQRAHVVPLTERSCQLGSLVPGTERGLRLVEVPSAVEVVKDFRPTPQLMLSESEVALMAACLIRNSLEAMPSGGVLTLRSFGTVEGEDLCLEVEDSGPGLSAAEETAAWKPFVTSKAGHKGLGLNVTRRIARQYKATLTVANLERGRGLVARLSFPLTAQEQR